MNKMKAKARRARDRISRRFGGANASTSALVPAAVQHSNPSPRPVSAGGPLPPRITNPTQPQTPHDPVVPNAIASISSVPVCVVSVPQLIITPCGDSSGLAISTSASHETQEIPPPKSLVVRDGRLEPSATAQNLGVLRAPIERVNQSEVLFSRVLSFRLIS